MRARHLATILAGLILGSTAVSAKPAIDPAPAAIVRTQSGALSGKDRPSGIRTYLGIPYAAAPVRDLRWRAPQPAPVWSGIRSAAEFGPQCFQPLRNATANSYAGAETMSEDCLYLNVWTKPGTKKAPVIVYIHGGAFYTGAGSFPIYDGETIAEHGAVFVNLNYRVGPLGFLALPELSAESAHGASGNYGLLDQIAALQWIKRNISEFGGDPDNIMIVGQSAGSMSVLTLQASPLAKGLFQRAVGMSGAMIAGAITMPSLAEAEEAGSKLEGVWKAANLLQLRAMPADRLVVPRVPGGPSTGPAIDGYVLPAPITEIFKRGQQADVPLMLGFTRDEALGGMGPVEGLTEYMAKAQAQYGDRATKFLELYRATNDAEAKAQSRLADRDNTVALGMFAWASLQKAHGHAPVFAYEFARPHSFAPGVVFSDLDPASAGAYHTSEVPFWLGTLDSFNRYRHTRDWTAKDRQIGEKMVTALIAFARTGSPNAPGAVFPQFDAGMPRLTMIADDLRPAPWPARERLLFFDTSNTISNP
ncbi:para-nitrobenzyl esterase [Novosphingobium mathurense]|uniref:Carboxylic ester hydrolase n=1 Tax=Novosphingobium mathurense TaxID=428990 RepID=A0A1U6HTB3_9SPHN|nr:para-nitrobenzyl esterase [Novosphingobium mathurense]